MQPHQRTRGQVACVPCRQRKSRCTFEPLATACLMCRSHRTDCVFPAGRASAASPSPQSKRQRVDAPRRSHEPATSAAESGLAGGDVIASRNINHSSLDEVEDDSPHIVGPAVSQDNYVLEDYLSSIDHASSARRIKRVIPGLTTGSIVFSRVTKRPLGSIDSNHAASKLQMIEKLLDPWRPQIIDLYFRKANRCFPIIDEGSFREQFETIKHRLSPAMLSCLYANALVYWKSDPELSVKRQHDDRFVWNLALDALYSELHLYPGSSTIAAILLDIEGRPYTTVIGNGALLGAAISLAHGLGLNRDPTSWNISGAEKSHRMQVWWCLVIYDRWSSFAHGTPPHIRSSQHDVPLPSEEEVTATLGDTARRQPHATFGALASLSEVLSACLERIYFLKREPHGDQRHLSRALDDWIDHLNRDLRRLILRGTQLDIDGAGNLRLAYLATKFLIHKIEFDAQGISDPSEKANDSKYIQTRRSAEEIVLFVQELDRHQLSGYWHGVSSFIFSTTATFLIRSAVDTDLPRAGPDQSPSLSLARDLIECLRRHGEQSGWDIGESTIAQYSDILEQLSELGRTTHPQGEASAVLDFGAMENLTPDYLDYYAFNELI